MFIEQAEMIDKVIRDIEPKDLANYLVFNYVKYSDDLMFNIEVELQEYEKEHSGQTYISFTNKDEFEI